MPVHTIASILGEVDSYMLISGAVALFGLLTIKSWSSGRKCTRERDWAGKLIMVLAPPTPTTLALLDALLQLPSPPQILYLPPYPSPLPASLVTLIHTLRLGSESNPRAQIHCEPCPPTPEGVREFASKWGKVEYGTAGEGGRRVDAIVLGGAWEIKTTDSFGSIGEVTGEKETVKWTPHQYHFHFITSLLPTLLRAPAERSIRIVSLLSPTYSAGIPNLRGESPTPRPSSSPSSSSSLLYASAQKGIITALLISHLKLILDTLASATFGTNVPVPDPEKPVLKHRDEKIQSNILAIGVIMPWARDEVVGSLIGITRSWTRFFIYILFYPLLIILTPSPKHAIQSVLFALSAPIRYPNGTVSPSSSDLEKVDRSAKSKSRTESSNSDGAQSSLQGADKEKTIDKEKEDPRRIAVGQGDFIRDCAVFDLPPVLYDPVLARETYEKIEKEVEAGVKREATRQRAFGSTNSGSDSTTTTTL